MIALLDRASKIKRANQTAKVLQDQIMAGDRLYFATLADLTLPHVWATNAQGLILGSLLEVDDTIFDSAIGNGWTLVLSMEEALLEGWADLEQYELFAEIYVNVLNNAAKLAQSQKKRMRLQAKSAIDRIADDSENQRDI